MKSQLDKLDDDIQKNYMHQKAFNSRFNAQISMCKETRKVIDADISALDQRLKHVEQAANGKRRAEAPNGPF